MTCINKYYNCTVKVACGKHRNGGAETSDDCCDDLNSILEDILERLKKVENCCRNNNGGGDDSDTDTDTDTDSDSDTDTDSDETNIGDDDTLPGLAKITLVGGTSADFFTDVLCADDGYVACGYTASSGATAGSYDGLIVKFDKNLEPMNMISFGGKAGENLHSLKPTMDGGYFTVGCGSDPTSFLLVAMDDNLNITHAKMLSTSYSEFLYAADAVPAGFSGVASYVVAGYYGTKAFIATYDKDFNVLKKVASAGATNCFKGVVANESGFVAVGYTNTVGVADGYDCFIASFDEVLNVKKKIFVGGSGNDHLTCIARINGGYVVGGYTTGAASFGFSSSNTGLVMVLDDDLKIVKKVLLGGTGADVINSIKVSKGDNYVVTGQTTSAGAGGNDAMIIVLDPNLNILKQMVFGGSKDENARSVAIDKDGTYIVVGDTLSAGAGSNDAFIGAFGGNFDDIAGSLVQYPALIVNSVPSLQAESNFNFTYNDNNTLTFATSTPHTVIEDGDVKLVVNKTPALLVNPNAVI